MSEAVCRVNIPNTRPIATGVFTAFQTDVQIIRPTEWVDPPVVVPEDGVSHLFENLDYGQTYFVRAVSMLNDEEGMPSNVHSFTVRGGDWFVTNAPTKHDAVGTVAVDDSTYINATAIGSVVEFRLSGTIGIHRDDWKLSVRARAGAGIGLMVRLYEGGLILRKEFLIDDLTESFQTKELMFTTEEAESFESLNNVKLELEFVSV